MDKAVPHAGNFPPRYIWIFLVHFRREIFYRLSNNLNTTGKLSSVIISTFRPNLSSNSSASLKSAFNV